MTRILLDTHVFVWWAESSPHVKAGWVDEVLDPDNLVYVSAVTGLEIETKKRLGKLIFDHSVAELIDSLGFESLPVTLDHATIAGAMDWEHRDPFDRVLVAQAQTNDMLLLSADAAILAAPKVRVL